MGAGHCSRAGEGVRWPTFVGGDRRQATCGQENSRDNGNCRSSSRNSSELVETLQPAVCAGGADGLGDLPVIGDHWRRPGEIGRVVGKHREDLVNPRKAVEFADGPAAAGEACWWLPLISETE